MRKVETNAEETVIDIWYEIKDKMMEVWITDSRGEDRYLGNMPKPNLGPDPDEDTECKEQNDNPYLTVAIEIASQLGYKLEMC